MKKSALPQGFKIILLLFQICFPLHLHAEETIRHVYTSTMPDQDMEDLLYLAVGIELARAGFTSTLSSAPADYRLAAAYENAGDAVAVILRLARDGEGSAVLSETDFPLFLDASLDTTIAEAVRTLLVAAKIGMIPTIDAEIEGLLSKPAEAPVDTAVDRIAGQTAPLSPTKLPPEPGTATAFVDTYIALGGVALFGAATDYFHYGAIGVLGAGYAIPLGKVTLTPGLRVSATRIFNNEGVTGNPLYLSTIGANLQLGTGNNVPYRASVVASGGAAVLSITASGKLLSKSVPYADFGVHSGVPLGKGFFIGGEVRFLMVFDKDIFLMGAVPVFALNKEF